MMATHKLQISKKSYPKGDDGYKTFSVRLKETTVAELDNLAKVTGRSRNELINLLLEYGIQNSEIVDE